ncbi:uncharacterized protein Bfra_005017 [Botrytis fragariae]|uniref:Uncharacterized protein n=1 Tax=Botrytis fragariae TaxID=1964551 RepID=A0A8H6EIJ9_9HELO|nr:uncharacterized protein Bfra_005017 [Botrytis fragariae]KAF5873554.1 hypothetical protein Bfra_005017 [Botrytis fragariae]
MCSYVSEDDVEYNWKMILDSWDIPNPTCFYQIWACAVPRTADITTADSTVSPKNKTISIQSRQGVSRAPNPLGYE